MYGYVEDVPYGEIEDDEYNAKAEYVLRNKYNDVKTRALIQARGAYKLFECIPCRWRSPGTQAPR